MLLRGRYPRVHRGTARAPVGRVVSALHYHHVDVFSSAPYGGNSLPVFLGADGLTGAQMLRITQELRHFEAIFLAPGGAVDTVQARIFDLREELPFAGHPLIGAAAVLHARARHDRDATWRFELASRTVTVTTRPAHGGYYGLVDQGVAEWHGRVADSDPFAAAFGLHAEDLHADLPLEVVSTGLRYLIVPVRPSALGRARIRDDITGLLHGVGAQFAVLLDEAACEARHWNNDGVIEDTATGSAAGTIGAYRLRHRLVRGGETFTLHQGRFTGRASTIQVRAEGTHDRVGRVSVGGDVALLGRGTIDVLP
jgi:trans-2,3-dihydro-3-hydroxyanthranilate isomerase